MKKIISTNPGRNYEKIGEIPATPYGEIKEKVRMANTARSSWKDVGIDIRISYVKHIYDLCKKRKEEIADIITKEVGTPITECKAEIDWDFGYFDWFLDHAKEAIAPIVVGKDKTSVHTIYFEPMGSAAVITPWNLPFDLFLWGVIPNLLVGNTVVYKASEECVLSGKLMDDIMSEAKLPDGVFSEIYGDGEEGNYLVNEDVNLLWFTGSSEVGKKICAIAGKKFVKPILEMGGSNPAIIFPDADIDAAVSSVVTNRFMFCAQTCDADKRLIVHKSIYDTVVTKLQEKIAAMIVGDPQDPETTFGPLVSKKQLELLESQVADALKKGATVAIGGKRPGNLMGAYYYPTLLTNITRDMRVWKEEVFGPVLPITTFTDEDEAIRIANDTEYGLGSAVFTQNKKRIEHMISAIQSGTVAINGTGHFRPYNPFGGYKISGMGREHGIMGFQELCQVKLVSQPL